MTAATPRPLLREHGGPFFGSGAELAAPRADDREHRLRLHSVLSRALFAPQGDERVALEERP